MILPLGDEPNPPGVPVVTYALILVNCAAVFTREVTLPELEEGEWRHALDVNLTGATWMVRDAVAKMAADEVDTGVVINMSSLSRYGNRGQSNYVAAKAALAANTVTWAREFARFGIRVGAVAPGLIETPLTRNMHPRARQTLIDSIPLGRIGQSHDVWLGVKFIIENDYFTGRCIDIDGGLVMA